MSSHGPAPARGGEHRKICPNPDCSHIGGVFWTDEPRQVYCSNACKKAVQNQRYYEAHKNEVIERVLRNQRRGE